MWLSFNSVDDYNFKLLKTVTGVWVNVCNGKKTAGCQFVWEATARLSEAFGSISQALGSIRKQQLGCRKHSEALTRLSEEFGSKR